jgi:hypothetical protein
VNQLIQGGAEKLHPPLKVLRRMTERRRILFKERSSVMKIILITIALGAVLVAPAFAQQAPQTQTRQGWGSRVHVYAPEYYEQHHGNSNTNPDFQLGGRER